MFQHYGVREGKKCKEIFRKVFRLLLLSHSKGTNSRFKNLCLLSGGNQGDAVVIPGYYLTGEEEEKDQIDMPRKV